MSLFGDVVDAVAGFVPGGTTAVQGAGLVADVIGVGGGDDQRETICPGGVPLEKIGRAIQNSPAGERSRMRSIVTDPFHSQPFTPLGISLIISGGHDCNTTTDRGARDGRTLRGWVDRYGARQPPVSRATQDVGGTPSVFGGPGGAPLGVPLWAWLIVVGLVLAAVIYAVRG